MPFDVPVSIAPQVERVAADRHITPDEALVQIIQAGLERMLPPAASPRDILGAFASADETAATDAALELAMTDRERRNAQPAHA